MKIAIIEKQSKAILSVYEDDAPHVEKFGGTLGWSDVVEHIAVPDGMPIEAFDVTSDENGSLSFTINNVKHETWKRQKNKEALDAFTFQQGEKADQDIKTLLAPKDDTTHLMEKLDEMWIVLKAVIAHLGITDAQLDAKDPQASLAKADIEEARSVLFSAIQEIRSVRDSDVAAFAPPHGDVSPLYPA